MGGRERKEMEEKGWDRREGMGWNGMGWGRMELKRWNWMEGIEWKGCDERDRIEQKR